MNGRNGFVITELQGTKKDFIGAWIMRLLLTLFAAAILWVSKLILAGVMYLVNTLPPMQADVNTLKTDVADLKIGQIAAKTAITAAAVKAERDLSEAETRVKAEFSRQLNEQLKKKKLITNPGVHNDE